MRVKYQHWVIQESNWDNYLMQVVCKKMPINIWFQIFKNSRRLLFKNEFPEPVMKEYRKRKGCGILTREQLKMMGYQLVKD